MDGVRNGANNAPPLAGAEPQFPPDHHRNLPKKLLRLGLATSATAVGGLLPQLVPAFAGSSRNAAEDVPVPPQPTLFLFVVLFGGLSTIYVGCKVEAAATPGWRKTGVGIYFLCLLLLVAAVSLVGSDYCELALNFM